MADSFSETSDLRSAERQGRIDPPGDDQGAASRPRAASKVRRRALIALAMSVMLVSAKIWAVQWFAFGGASAVALLLDTLFVFALFAMVDLFFADMRLRSFLVTDAVMSVLVMALAVYHSYYGVLPSRQSLALAGQATTVGGGILTLLRPRYLVLFVDIPLIAFWSARLRRRGLDPVTGDRLDALSMNNGPIPYLYQTRLVYLAALAAAVLLMFTVHATAASPDAQDAVAVVYKRGVGSYLAVALLGPRSGPPSMQGGTVPEFQERADELARRVPGPPIGGFTPAQAAGKNVIVIQVEALQSIAVGSSVAGAPVTPNLDALIEDSWYFPNCASAGGVGTTADVEFTTNTSLYPPHDVGASLGWSDRQLTSLPRLLAAEGYQSYTFHTNEVTFWNRSQLYPALGFDGYFDRSYFGTDDKMGPFNSASDQVLFDKTLPRLLELRDANVPFYSQIITQSSHFPFENVPSNRRTLRLEPPYDGNIVGNYLAEVHWVDEQIGDFVSRLKQTGLWDESVVVIYGDHFGLPDPRNGAEEAALRALCGHDYNDSDRAFVPLIIHLPGQEGGVRVTSPAGQVDLVPTLADALGLDLSGMLHFGRSVLRSSGGVIAVGELLGHGAYVDESVLYVPAGEFRRGRAFDVLTGEQVDISSASETTWNDVKELIALSRQYVSTLPVREDFDPNAEISFPRRR